MDDSFLYIFELCDVAIIVHNLTFGQKSLGRLTVNTKKRSKSNCSRIDHIFQKCKAVNLFSDCI